MIPVIDFTSKTVLDEIREAYTTVGFAVFKNCLTVRDQQTMRYWFKKMKKFFGGQGGPTITTTAAAALGNGPFPLHDDFDDESKFKMDSDAPEANN